ncbi:TetR family transcriptional regulator [Actinoplanes sp. N902-109]|nr:TetR family transcriptional regulator [Actinoplanes sp. N902-109]
MVGTAVDIMRAEGLERVTMRRLAAELDTGPASLYVYVRNTAELHGAILDELLAGLDHPSDFAEQGWRDRLIALLTAYTITLYRYPSLARSVLTLRPSGPHYLRLIDSMLGLLHAGGVPLKQAAWGIDILLQQATSSAAEHGSRDQALESAEEEEELREAMAAASAEAFPHIDRARDELFSGTGEERMRWAFDTIIDGLRA